MSNKGMRTINCANEVILCKDGIYIKDQHGQRARIAEPILVTAFGSNEFSSPRGAAYVVVEFTDRKDKLRSVIIPAEFLTSQRTDFITLLSKRGYVWPQSRSSWFRIIGALSAMKPSRDIKLSPVPGPCGEWFVLPRESYGPEGPTREHIKLLRDDSVKLGMFRCSGTLEEWKRFVGKSCTHSSRARLAVAANFAAPNLRRLGLSSFGLNFSGMTSGGKTLLLRWAASTSGLNTDGGPTTWDGTPTSFEQRALGHRDCIMLLDDLSYVEDPRAIAKLVTFRLAGNRAKDRAGQYVHAHKLVETDYRVIGLSTSEDPVWADGHDRRVRGEEVRMINIRAGVSEAQDIFDADNAWRAVGRTVEERRAYVEEQEARAKKYQGVAFRVYLKKWRADSEATKTLNSYMADYRKKAPLLRSERWLARIQRSFAAIYASAAQAIDYGILPWNKEKTLEAIKTCMDDAMEQLIAKAAVAGDSVLPRSQQSLLAEFKRRMSGADFTRVGRGTKRDKESAKKLKHAQGIVRPTRPGRCEHLLFASAMESWFPNVSDRQRLTKYLREVKLLKNGRRRDTATRQVFLTELGKKVSCYGVWRARVRDFAVDAPG